MTKETPTPPCGCTTCGSADHTTANHETAMSDAVDQALLHGLFPDPMTRRTLLRTVGAATVLGALATILPVDALKAMASENGPLEKTDLNLGFLPITCAAPLIYGAELGEYAKQGLNVTLNKVPGVPVIRDKMINGELDISQQVMPVALTMSAGLGGQVMPTKVLSVLNQNGNSLVMAKRHADNNNPANWKGFTFAVPFEHSHQNLQLRAYLAMHGLNPDTDIRYRLVPPTEYVSQLRVGSIDGFFGGEPGGQRAVYEDAGFIHMISKEFWDGHPCCSVTATQAWIDAHPNTFMAIYRAIIASSLYVSDPANRGDMPEVLARPEYLNAPEIVIKQVVGGRYADGLGNLKEDPRRIDYQPFPHYAAAVWMMVQLKRWNYVDQDIDFKALAQEVMLATQAHDIMAELGGTPPEVAFGTETIGGEAFDSARPGDYL